MCSSRTYARCGRALNKLLRLDQSLCEMDQTRFWFACDATVRFNFQHIKLTIPSTVTDRRGIILATLALHLLEYLCDQRFPQITRLRKTNYDSGMIRNAPWMWRQRFMATRPPRAKHDARTAVPIELCFNFVGFFYRPDTYEERQSLLNLIYALDRVPTLLKHAAENEDLIMFASRHTIFPPQAFYFPRLRRRAQNAVNAYLAKFPAHPPASISLSEHFGEGHDERCGHRPRNPWDRICVLFPHLLAFLVYICFLWITCFA